MKIKLAGLVLFLVSGSLLAEAESFFVQSTITAGDKLVGSPGLTIAAGEEASISVGDSYTLSITATPGEEGRIYVAAELTVSGESVSPRILVELGQPFGMSIGDTAVSMTIFESVQDGT